MDCFFIFVRSTCVSSVTFECVFRYNTNEQNARTLLSDLSRFASDPVLTFHYPLYLGFQSFDCHLLDDSTFCSIHFSLRFFSFARSCFFFSNWSYHVFGNIHFLLTRFVCLGDLLSFCTDRSALFCPPKVDPQSQAAFEEPTRI